MVAKRNRPQVSFSPAGPGLATRKAAAVPFIPAPKRSGVGQNERNMGSALSRLGSALGNFSARLENENKRDIHAERRRVSEMMARSSRLNQDERVEERKRFGISPVPDTIKEVSRVRMEDIPVIKKEVDEKFKEWAAAGWTTVDEDGARIPITEDDINAYFTEMTQAHVFDRYQVKGETGRLHQPQVKEYLRNIDFFRNQFMKKFTAYKHKELITDSYETVYNDAEPNLIASYFDKGLRGQQLLEHWMENGRKAFSTMSGNTTIPSATRSAIFRKQLEGFLHRMDSIGDVRLFQELLQAKIPGTGTTLENSSYRDLVERIKRKAEPFLKQAWYNEEVEGAHAKNFEDFSKNSFADFSTKKFVFRDGSAKTLTSKEQKTALVEKIKAKSRVDAGSDKDPSKKWEEQRRTITALAGSELLDDEIKNRFSRASFALAGQNPTDFDALLNLYRDIRVLDPAKLDEYITDADVRNKMRNLTRLRDTYPNMSNEEALSVMEESLGEDGKPPSWNEFHPEIAKAWRTFKKTRTFRRHGFDEEEVADLEAVMQMRMADPNERAKMDTSDSGGVDPSEFKAALDEEVEALKKTRATINGDIVRPPAGVGKEKYKAQVTLFRNQIAKQLKVSPDDIRLKSLSNGGGILFLDKNRRPLSLNGKQLLVGYKQINEWSKLAPNAALMAKSLRSSGSAVLRGDSESNLKKIEESRKSSDTISSWWDNMFRKSNEKMPAPIAPHAARQEQDKPKLVEPPTEVIRN